MTPRRSPPGAAGLAPDWRQLVDRHAEAAGIRLDPGQLAQFARYGQELIKWSQRFNLTAITDPEQIGVRHFLDSLAAVKLFAGSERMLDLGTGAGFPGLPIKLACPGVEMVLIDGSRKKISFVTHLIHTLGLQGVGALQVRSEELQHDPRHRHAYEVVLSRAVTSLDALVGQARGLLRNGGRLVAWKAEGAEKEIAELERAAGRPGPLRDAVAEIGLSAYELADAGRRCLVTVVCRSGGQPPPRSR